MTTLKSNESSTKFIRERLLSCRKLRFRLHACVKQKYFTSIGAKQAFARRNRYSEVVARRKLCDATLNINSHGSRVENFSLALPTVRRAACTKCQIFCNKNVSDKKKVAYCCASYNFCTKLVCAATVFLFALNTFEQLIFTSTNTFGSLAINHA